MITAERIAKLCPNARADLVAAIVDGWPQMQAAAIVTPFRVQHFLATLATETGGLRAIEENLNYTAARIREVWPSRFKSAAAAAPYARNPQKLANKVYGARLGNGPEKSGDGWRFRGSGPIQTTGRSNFRAAGYEHDPDGLRDPRRSFPSAVKFWSDHGLNELADRDDVVAVRKRVNGSTNGLADMKTYLAKARKIFTTSVAVAPVVEPPAAKPARTKDEIKAIQRRLIELGYTEVGGTDGVAGKLTRGAIGTFRADNNLPLGDEIDDVFLAALMTAKPRVMAPERANATVADLREKGSSIIASSDVQKIGAVAIAGGTAAKPLIGFLTDAGEQVSQITDALDPFQAFLRFFADWIWVPVLIIALIIGWKAISIARARLVDHRTGNTSVVNLPAKIGEA